MAQSVENPTLDFSLGHGLPVWGIESHTDLYADSVEPAWDSLSSSLSLLIPCSYIFSHFLSLKINK